MTPTDDGLDLGELTRRAEADQYRELGAERQGQGDLEDAAAYYQMSLDLFPTPEAHTSLGTTLAARGQWEAAIAACEQAIALDPDLGNPYNDIGVYLAEQNRRDEALVFFDKAINAPRYESRNFPHYHRGRILEQMGRFTQARDAYAQSLQLDPDWPPARVGYLRALGWLN